MIEASYTLAEQLQQFLISEGLSVWLCSAWEGEKARSEINHTDLMLTVGGDGTILRAAQVALLSQTPITGINLGKLGFMTELSADEALAKLPALLSGQGWIDERDMIEVGLSPSEQGREATGILYALNDVVVARGAIARVVYIEARVDDELLSTYKADGVIVATATGSTGYSLAAGGPILNPQSKEFILLPILPHLSSAYPLVLPSTAVVKLHVSTAHEATLSVDGHINIHLDSGAVITVKHGSAKARFLRIHPSNFYSSLELKLKGKQ